VRDDATRIDLGTRAAWEGLTAGTRLGPLTWSLSREEQEIRLDALEVTHPGYRTASLSCRPFMFPVFFQDLYYRLMDLRYDWPLAVAARLEIESHRPAHADEVFDGTLEIIDRYERRGGHYLVTETRITGAGHTPVCTLRNWALLNPRDRYVP
jgi:hypothetical protein